ncbi:hypothetical protein SprV_0802618300 [Sparganum proliferum]
MKILNLIFSISCVTVVASEELSYKTLSNGFEDNIVSSVDKCQWVEINLPEPLLSIELDELNILCNNGTCKAETNETTDIQYNQKKEGRYYQVSARFCEPYLMKYFRIGWRVEEFERPGRKTLLTQFIVPENNWTMSNKSCIQPQYSLPLMQSVNESSQVTVQCTIRNSSCHKNESIVIFDLNNVFCVYNETIKTCNRTEEKDGIVHYTTTVSNPAENKYFPDHYVFCNSNDSYMSIRLTWNSDQRSTTTEENIATTASTPEQRSTIIVETETTTTISNINDPCTCPNADKAIELPTCKRTAIFHCSGYCRE